MKQDDVHARINPDAEYQKHRLHVWAHAGFDGSMVPDKPVAWSRQNLVAYGTSDEHGACVLIVPSACAVHGGKVNASQVVARLHPPPRAPPIATSTPYELDAPSLVSFSPCGHTLLAYFPVMPVLTTNEPLVPSASLELSTPLVLPVDQSAAVSPSANAMNASMSAATMNAAINTAGASTNASAGASAFTSPAMTPLATPRGLVRTLSGHSTSPGMDALGMGMGSATTSLLPYDHGVLCIWTRTSPSISATDQWILQQWFPVSLPVSTLSTSGASTAAASAAAATGTASSLSSVPTAAATGASATTPPAAPSTGPSSLSKLSGDMIDVCWLDSARAWKCTETDFVRAPSSGPSTSVPAAGLPLDKSADEQACVVVSRLGQVVFLHRVHEKSMFRIHIGCLQVPGVYPPPASYEPTTLESVFSAMEIRHVSMATMSDAPILLVAYQSSISGSAMFVNMTELVFELNGDLSYFFINPQSSVTMRSLEEALSGTKHRYQVLTSMSWSRDAGGDLALMFAVATDEGASEPVWSSRSLRDTMLYVWDVRQSQNKRVDELRCIFESSPSQIASDETDKAWRITPLTLRHIPGLVLSSIIPACSPVPHAHKIYATAFVMDHMDREIWGTIDTKTYEWTSLEMQVPPHVLMRSSLALSPCGVLACMLIRPGRQLGCLCLPIQSHSIPTLGRLAALSLLRHATPMDVAHFLLRHHALTHDFIIAMVQATANALAFNDNHNNPSGAAPLTLTQTKLVLPLVLALTSECADTSQRLLHARTCVFVSLFHMYQELSIARHDTTNARFADLLGHTAYASFHPSTVWTLARILQTLTEWLERALCTAMQCNMPGARPADVPADALLELCLHTNARRLLCEVLSGVCVYTTWIQQLTNESWLSLLGADVRPSSSKCDAAIHRLWNIQSHIKDILNATPLVLEHVLPFFSVLPRGMNDVAAFWDSWLGVRALHASDAVFDHARNAFEACDRAILDHVALVERCARPAQHVPPPWPYTY